MTRKFISVVIIAAFISTSLRIPVYAQMVDPMPHMAAPGVMVPLSPEFTPAFLKGIVIHPENALKFDFIIYRGDKELTDTQKRQEYTKLTKYFLASLAIPDDDQWVNLSPYEKDRIINDDFGKTEMGRDLLAQDYMLKQITASLIYPQNNLGKKFWDKVYAQAQAKFGTTNVPVNTFNKVWILPDDALIYEKGNTAYVLKNHLKVMLEEDYLSLQKHTGIQSAPMDAKTHSIASQIVKEIVLPELEREVNEDKNFTAVRQVYSGMLLAAWYKRALKESLLSKIYSNKAKVKGVDQDPKTNERIYRQYLRAYKKGVFNFIKEDVDKYTNEIIPRKYFSGGAVDFAQAAQELGHDPINITSDPAQLAEVQRELGTNKYDLAQAVAEESGVVKALDAAMAVQNVEVVWGRKSLPSSVKVRPSTQAPGALEVYDITYNAQVKAIHNENENWVNNLLINPGESLRFGRRAGVLYMIVSEAREYHLTSKGFEYTGPFVNDGSFKATREFSNINGALSVRVFGATGTTIKDGVHPNVVLNANQGLPAPINFDAAMISRLRVAAVAAALVGAAGITAATMPSAPHQAAAPAYTSSFVQKDMTSEAIVQREDVIRSGNQYFGIQTPGNGDLIATHGDQRQEWTGVKDFTVVRNASLLEKAGYRIIVNSNGKYFAWDGGVSPSAPISLQEGEGYFSGNLFAKVLTNEQDETLAAKLQADLPSGAKVYAGNRSLSLQIFNDSTIKQVNASYLIGAAVLNGALWEVSVDNNTPSQEEIVSIDTTTGQVKHHLAEDLSAQEAGALNLQAAPKKVAMTDQAMSVSDAMEIAHKMLKYSPGQTKFNLGAAMNSRLTVHYRDLAEEMEALIVRGEGLARQKEAERVLAELLLELQGKPEDYQIPGMPGFTKADIIEPDNIDNSSKAKINSSAEVIQRRMLGLTPRPQEIRRMVDAETNITLGGVSEDALISLSTPSYGHPELFRVSDITPGYGHPEILRVEDVVVNSSLNFRQRLALWADDISFYLKIDYVGYVFERTRLAVRALISREEKYTPAGRKFAAGAAQMKAVKTPGRIASLVRRIRGGSDKAMSAYGGIDFNAANLDLQIKRDGRGVPLPIAQQDLENIHIDGLIPVILSIKPAIQTPLLSELQGNSP